MRIVVNDIAASSGGALSILTNFYNYISETDKDNEWIFLLNDRYFEETDNIKIIVLESVKRNWLNRFVFDLFTGKKLLSLLNADIIFSLQNTIIYGIKLPQIIYMHQSLPFQNIKKFSLFKSKERLLAVYQYIIGYLIKKSIKKADKVIVQTKWIKKAILKSVKVTDQKIVVIQPDIGDYRKYKKGNIFNKNNFFYPAADSIYKNHQCIYNACEILKKQGIKDFNITLTINSSDKKDHINYTGPLPFETVLEKYNSSTLIFPSYIETVGLPLLEARQMGTIILASDCPYSREVLKNYINAYFFDPFKPKELAELIKKILEGEIVKKDVIDDKYKFENSWRKVVDILNK